MIDNSIELIKQHFAQEIETLLTDKECIPEGVHNYQLTVTKEITAKFERILKNKKLFSDLTPEIIVRLLCNPDISQYAKDKKYGSYANLYQSVADHVLFLILEKIDPVLANAVTIPVANTNDQYWTDCPWKYLKTDDKQFIELKNRFIDSDTFLIVLRQYRGSGLKKLTKQNRIATFEFVEKLVDYYRKTFSLDNFNEVFSELLMVLYGLITELHAVGKGKFGKGKGNEFARYMTTAIINVFGIISDKKLADNDETLFEKLSFIKHLLRLQAFIFNPNSNNQFVLNAIFKLIALNILKERDWLSHSEKRDFAYNLVLQLLKLQTKGDYVALFGEINRGIGLSRSVGRQEASMELEKTLIYVRDSLIKAIVSRQTMPQNSNFDAPTLSAIFEYICTEEDVSPEAIPFLGFMAKQLPEFKDKEAVTLVNQYVNFVFKEREKNAQEVDWPSYAGSHINAVVKFFRENYDSNTSIQASLNVLAQRFHEQANIFVRKNGIMGMDAFLSELPHYFKPKQQDNVSALTASMGNLMQDVNANTSATQYEYRGSAIILKSPGENAN